MMAIKTHTHTLSNVHVDVTDDDYDECNTQHRPNKDQGTRRERTSAPTEEERKRRKIRQLMGRCVTREEEEEEEDNVQIHTNHNKKGQTIMSC